MLAVYMSGMVVYHMVVEHGSTIGTKKTKNHAARCERLIFEKVRVYIRDSNQNLSFCRRRMMNVLFPLPRREATHCKVKQFIVVRRP